MKQANGGQRHKIDAYIKQMALLNQKLLFPQLKPHAQPGPALHRYIRLNEQPHENVGTGY